MYVFNLKSLVLSGVSVLCDGQTVAARLGFGYPTASHLRVNPISMRHSASRTNDSDASAPPTEREVSGAIRQRAGRSVRRTGVLVSPWTRVSPTTRGGSRPTATWWSCIFAGSLASVGLQKIPLQAVQAQPQRILPGGLRPSGTMQRMGRRVIRGKFA
jgi:hypothetical protein